MKTYKFAIFALIIALFFGFSLCGYTKELHVVTTLDLLKDITQQIGKDKVRVESILTGLQNPHTYDAKPKDIIALSKADIFIEIGGGLEGFVDKILRNVKKKDLIVVKLIEGIPLIGKNPHIWLDPENGKIIAKKISETLCRARPEEESFFQKNLLIYTNRIDKVEKEIGVKLSRLNDKRVISSLPTFVYFYKRFGFKEVGQVVELPGHEPSFRKIKELIVLIKKEKIPFLVTNPFVKVKPVKVIKEETGIKEVPLLPLLHKAFGVTTYLDMIKYNGEAFLKDE